LLAKSVNPYIKGHVHAQLSPRYAYSISDSLAHAHRLIDLFAKNGIPSNRVCLKIPSTGAGLVVCSQLQKEGINTLATTLFSVDQAVAAVQAGCLYIAPYFNELSVHFEPETWVDYGDETADKHPMCPVIRDIVKMYKLLDKKPLVMPARSVIVAGTAWCY
jgi:transaldolase